MKRKIFITILVFALSILCSTISFATDFGTEIQDSANKTGESMQSVGNGVMNFTNNVGNGIKNVAEGIGNGIRNTAEDIGRGVESMFDGDNPNTTSNSSYNAVRTSTETDFSNAGSGMANTAWIWLILGITGIIIVALTWYYVSQDTGNNRKS